jgi:hypothetical protein
MKPTRFFSNSVLIPPFEDANIEINKKINWIGANILSLNSIKVNYTVIQPAHNKFKFDSKNMLINGIQLKRIG